MGSKLCPKIILEGTRLVNESILPRLELDVSDSDVPHAAERIADWMTETGGLWAR